MIEAHALAGAHHASNESIGVEPVLDFRWADGPFRKMWIERAGTDVAALGKPFLGKLLRFPFGRKGSRVPDVVLTLGRVRVLERDIPPVSECATTPGSSRADQTQRPAPNAFAHAASIEGSPDPSRHWLKRVSDLI
jgi:hypothetical protein